MNDGSTKFSFRVIWVSYRGFANEGTFFHGSVEDFDAYFERTALDENSRVKTISRHRTEAAACAAAMRATKTANRNHRAWGELAGCSASPVADVFA